MFHFMEIMKHLFTKKSVSSVPHLEWSVKHQTMSHPHNLYDLLSILQSRTVSTGKKKERKRKKMKSSLNILFFNSWHSSGRQETRPGLLQMQCWNHEVIGANTNRSFLFLSKTSPVFNLSLKNVFLIKASCWIQVEFANSFRMTD